MVRSRGWFFQAYAPLVTMLNVRNAGQTSHNDQDLSLLKRVWAAKNVSIETALFEFSNSDVPLSWHLSPRELTQGRAS
jgi:hypothetical protein